MADTYGSGAAATKNIESKLRGIAVPYVTSRAIQARLDEVVGVDGWYNDYRPWHGTGKKEAQICGISTRFPELWLNRML